MAAFVAVSASIIGCNKMNEPEPQTEVQTPQTVATKTYGTKTPKVACYVETNDVNPLNAADYYLADGTTFFDMVELFASNIHKDVATGDPTLYLNDKLANVLENGGVDTYVRPLQGLGIKVLLTVLGDWAGIGVANMTDTQADHFATILAYTVERYGLDGIGFDDEYADYPWFSVNNTSYSRIITKLHELMPSDKLITVFDWGNTNTISSSAAAYIDYAYHGYFGAYIPVEESNIAGMDKAAAYIDYAYHGYFGAYIPVEESNIAGMDKSRWSPVSLNLGLDNSNIDVEGQARDAKNDGYGAMMCFNLRTRNDVDALPVLQEMSNGAFGGLGVICTNGNQPRNATIDPDGFTITYEMATAN